MGRLYDDENYEMSSEAEVSDMLDDIPVELTKSSIANQINNPLFSDVDFFESFTERCDLIIRRYEDDAIIGKVKDFKLEMAVFILTALDKKFGFDFDLETVANDEAAMTSYADVCYRYFVLQYKKLVTKYVYKFIKKNKDALYKAYDEKVSKKDVSSINAKSLAKEKEYVVILSALPSIVKDIMAMDCDAEDFISLTAAEDSYEGGTIIDMVQKGIITGDFVSNYFNMILANNDASFGEVYSKVRTKIINKMEKE